MTEELIQPNNELPPIGLYNKIFEAMRAIGYLQKDDTLKYNDKPMYKFLSEEKVTNSVRDALIKVGLIMIPARVKVTPVMETKQRFDKSGALLTETINVKTVVEVTYKVIDIETGEFEFVMSCGKGADTGDKDSNKAMTGAFKYAQRQTFFIPSGDDPDKESSDGFTEKIEGKPGNAPATNDTTSGNKDLDAEVEKLIEGATDPDIARKLVAAYKGPIEGLIKLLSERQKK